MILSERNGINVRCLLTDDDLFQVTRLYVFDQAVASEDIGSKLNKKFSTPAILGINP